MKKLSNTEAGFKKKKKTIAYKKACIKMPLINCEIQIKLN